MEKEMVIVMGVIGADCHAVGNKILERFFRDSGFKVVNLGVMVSQDEYIDAAIETGAEAILVSSLYGHGEIDCQGFRERCTERGLENIVLYVGGNLVVGAELVGAHGRDLSTRRTRGFARHPQRQLRNYPERGDPQTALCRRGVAHVELARGVEPVPAVVETPAQIVDRGRGAVQRLDAQAPLRVGGEDRALGPRGTDVDAETAFHKPKIN